MWEHPHVGRVPSHLVGEVDLMWMHLSSSHISPQGVLAAITLVGDVVVMEYLEADQGERWDFLSAQ